jgi:acyl carrier protein
MLVRPAVESTIISVAAENDKVLPPLTDDLPLLECGLDSLCLAVIVARLEDEFGVDPFAGPDDLEYPVTVGDFVTLYEKAVLAGAA